MAGRPRISNRVGRISKSAIHEMTRLSKERRRRGVSVLGETASDTPSISRKSTIVAIRERLVGGYSENAGLLELREEIVKKLKRDNHVDAEVSQIMVTVGAIEGLAAAVMAVVDPGDEVILPSPTYSTHVRQVVIASGKPVFVPAIEEEAFALDIQGIENAITPRTKAILFCSPNNPTGTVWAEEQLRQVSQIALEANLMVITDEAYEYFTYDGHRHFSIASIPEMRQNVISCYTFTKTYAMTGWRIGYLHADEEFIPQINKAHIPLAICAPVVSQYAALAALRGPQDCVARFREHYLSARNLMCERLERLSSVFAYERPNGSYLMFPKILLEEGKDSTGFCKRLLKEGGVSTTPGIAFGPTGQGHLRMSFCVPEGEINKAI